MKAAALAAWNSGGIGENIDEGSEEVEGSLSTVSCDNCEVAAVTEAELSVVARLAFDAERRMVGVSNDSRALGSSNAVNLPIAGRYRTCEHRYHQPIQYDREKRGQDT